MTDIETRTITELLLEWQSSGDPSDFETLAAAVLPIVETHAAASLRRSGIRSLAAVDDAVSLVLDHLRRLHPADDVETPVTPFAPRSQDCDDEGRRYVVWLTRGRACDVLRAERRRSQRTPTFSDLCSPRRHEVSRSSPALGVSAPSATILQPSDADSASCESERRIVSFKRLIRSLPGDDRRVVEMLLNSVPQTVIAGTLGVSEGTVSRRKAAVLAKLRRHLEAAWRCGTEQLATDHGPEPPPCQPAEPEALGRDAPPFVVFSATATRSSKITRASSWHLFGLVTKGSARSTWLSAPGCPQAYAHDGTCGYFPPGVQHRFYFEPMGRTTVLHVAMAPEYVRLVADREGQRISGDLHGAHCFEDPLLAAMLRRFDDRAGEAADSLAADLNGRAIVMRLLELQGCKMPVWHRDPSRFTRSEMKSLCDYVDGSLETTFRLDSLAALVHLSPGHFSRKFRLSFGVSAVEFVRARRVREAARLLLADDLSIAAIAHRVGFSSQSHFAQVFRSIIGTSPVQFRLECS